MSNRYHRCSNRIVSNIEPLLQEYVMHWPDAYVLDHPMLKNIPEDIIIVAKLQGIELTDLTEYAETIERNWEIYKKRF